MGILKQIKEKENHFHRGMWFSKIWLPNTNIKILLSVKSQPFSKIWLPNTNAKIFLFVGKTASKMAVIRG
jgi:hypothetical protein